MTAVFDVCNEFGRLLDETPFKHLIARRCEGAGIAPVGREICDQLTFAIRYDVYLRERALTPGTPDWELKAWTWRQKTPRRK